MPPEQPGPPTASTTDYARDVRDYWHAIMASVSNDNAGVWAPVCRFSYPPLHIVREPR